MDRIENCISFLLGKASQRVTRRARELLAEHDVTPVQYAALSVLWQQDRQTSAELGARLAIDSATMTGIIDRLEKTELVERHPDGADRRIYRIQLTQRGRKLRAPLDSAMEKLNREMSEILGQQSGQFYKMLRTVGEIR
jgi:DNA-binding MarR family transcriptional regulator